MSRLRITLLYRLPVAAYCTLIFWQSSSASLTSLPSFEYSDKVMHLGGYALLGALVVRALLHEPFHLSRQKIIIAAILFSILYGVSDEIHQSFVPERCADIFDVLADGLGSIIGVLFYSAVVAIKAQRYEGEG